MVIKPSELSDHEETNAKPVDLGGEDDGSTSVEGKDDHLHEDQKPKTE